MGIAIYLPALALNAVTPLHLYWTIALTGGICTFYTSLVSLNPCLNEMQKNKHRILCGLLKAFMKRYINSIFANFLRQNSHSVNLHSVPGEKSFIFAFYILIILF